MRHSSFVILILFATLLPAGARAYDDETLRGLCEVGDHVESASACRTLAKRAAGTPAERSLRAAWARLELRRCRGAACGEPLEELWRHSDRPVELSGVAARAQSACAAGDERACSLAAAAAWMGLGASLDPVGAMNLAAKGKGGSPARWEALAPAGFRRDPLTTARTLAAAGEHAGVLLVLDDAMRRGLLSGAGLGQARRCGPSPPLAAGTSSSSRCDGRGTSSRPLRSASCWWRRCLRRGPSTCV